MHPIAYIIIVTGLAFAAYLLCRLGAERVEAENEAKGD